MFVIDIILIYTIMLNDVEERTYEFAMLRTLGFKKFNLVVVLMVQALFFSIPSTFIGFVLLFIFKNATQVLLYDYAGISCNLPVNQDTVIIGLVTGIIVPMVSNVIPIKQALGTSLRNALDRFRQGTDDIEVSFIRMENFSIDGP